MSRWLAVMRLMEYTMGMWVYPPLDAEITAVVLEEVETYVLHLHNTIAQYIATRLILEICLAE